MVNSCVAFGCTNRVGSGVSFHKIPTDKERQKLWLIALKLEKPPNLKHAWVCSNHFLDEDYMSSYRLQSELLGRKTKRTNLLYQVCFPSTKKNQERKKKRDDRD